MFCNNCGKSVEDSAKFCTNCGSLVDKGLEQSEVVEVSVQRGQAVVAPNVSKAVATFLTMLLVVFIVSSGFSFVVDFGGFIQYLGVELEISTGFSIFDFLSTSKSVSEVSTAVNDVVSSVMSGSVQSIPGFGSLMNFGENEISFFRDFEGIASSMFVATSVISVLFVASLVCLFVFVYLNSLGSRSCVFFGQLGSLMSVLMSAANLFLFSVIKDQFLDLIPLLGLPAVSNWTGMISIEPDVFVYLSFVFSVIVFCFITFKKRLIGE
jgi:hypothetical protein